MKYSNTPRRARVVPPLHPDFQPAVEATRRLRHVAADDEHSVGIAVAVVSNDGTAHRSDLVLPAPDSEHSELARHCLERHVKFLLWACGGYRVVIAAPQEYVLPIREAYAAGGARSFDADMMQRVFGCPFRVDPVALEEVPDGTVRSRRIGGHRDGCRVGFDLGASDYKLAAVNDGEAVFTTEIRWDPVPQADPEYHRSRILDGLRMAASHLPRLDAVGGSAAGIYVDNEVRSASLFRSVPPDLFAQRVRPMFREIADELGVPFELANDGDVTALAGSMSLGVTAVLGIAMGSSEAVGYLDREGRITGRLNELAFAPVDFDLHAPADEWSGDHGVGAMYFSQQAVNHLAPAAGFSFPEDMLLPERLKVVQAACEEGNPGADRIFETIGVYLGYSLPHYAAYYDFDHVLVLGRVTSGRGGEILIQTARTVLADHFAEFAHRVQIHVPDEAGRRVGQAVAAASLPERS